MQDNFFILLILGRDCFALLLNGPGTENMSSREKVNVSGQDLGVGTFPGSLRISVSPHCTAADIPDNQVCAQHVRHAFCQSMDSVTGCVCIPH